MNTKENKHTLWELSKSFFQYGMNRNEIIALFEATIQNVDAKCGGDLIEKNKVFLVEFVKALSTLRLETGEPVVEVEEVPVSDSVEQRLQRIEVQLGEILLLLKASSMNLRME